MTIAAVGGQAGGASATVAASVARAFGSNVSAGSLVVVIGTRFSADLDPFVAGDCTKSAGTAVLGTIALDVSLNLDIGSGLYETVGIWSAIVTTGGSCTMQVGGGDTADYPNIGTHEFTGNWNASRLEASNTSSTATDNVTPAVTGNGTSVGAALFVAGLSADITTNGAVTQDGAFTLIYEDETGATNNTCSSIYRIVSTGTTDQGEWTVGTTLNQGWVAALAVYKEVVAAGANFQQFAAGKPRWR